MIPASYLFKDMYQQAWETPDAEPGTEPRQRFFDGLVTPIAAAFGALLRARHKPGTRYLGTHAYD